MYAIRNSLDKIVLLLLDAGADPNVAARNGVTALMLSLVGQHVEIVKNLIDTGAYTHILDEKLKTPLMYAAKYGVQDIVTTLCLKDKTNINTENRLGKAALMLAMQHENMSIAKILIDAGADLWAENAKKENAVDIYVYNHSGTECPFDTRNNNSTLG